MVICRYFQQGNCRFGNTCRNEHAYNSQYNYQSSAAPVRQPQQNAVTNNPQNEIAIQIRSIITDMNAAEQGKQWLLSCYGPFKGKANFPTFEDHSFEEIRWMIYNAQKQGNSDAVIQLYTQMVQEAKRKFTYYQTPTRELIDTIKNLYSTTDTAKTTPPNFGNNTPVINQANNAPTQNFTNTNSIFNQANSQTIQPNRNQSIFGGANQQQSNNVFSGAINQSFPYNSQTNNVFQTATNQSNSIFNTNTQNTTSTNNVFGQANPKPENANVFGTASNAFGSTNNGTTNVFGSSNGGTISNGTTNVFGATNNASNATTNVFGSTTSGPANNGTTNVFGSTNSGTSNNGTTNVFGSTNSGTSNNGTTNVFGSTNSGTSSNGTTNVFGATNSPLAQNTSIFSSNTPLAQNTNVFGGNQPANSPLANNVFGSNQFNTFQTQQNSVFAQNPTKNDNIFVNSSMAPLQNVFSSQNVVDNSKQLVNPFISNQPSSSSVFGNGANSTNSQIKQESSDNVQIYSKIEDLSETDIKAFQSERFEFGCIPILPPPSSLCYAS